MMDESKEELLEDTFEELIEETGRWTKEEALYVEIPEITVDCQKCAFFNPAGSCELVEGTISPEGHCRFWVDMKEVSTEEDTQESYNLSQSIEDLEAEEDFFYILALMQDEKLANYKFDTLLENLVSDLSSDELQELSNSKAVSLTKEDKNESGGLTSKGRAKFNKIQGSNLKAPVDRKPKTLEEIRRQGSFLVRFYGRDKIPPLKKPNGKPTRYSLAASVWSSPIPKTVADVRRLAAKGRALLARYEKLKEKSKAKKSKQKLSQSETPNLPICLSNGMVKIPIAKKGSWYHDVHGTVSFTEEDFKQIREQSSKDVLGFTPYITYGHPTNLPYESVDAELKKGDLKGWQEEEDTLFGLFEVKDDLLKLVEEKEYEYSSGEFLRNFKDKNTGENRGTILMRVALTNSPFIPFGDTKIETLSISNSCLPNSVPFVIKLSADTNNQTNLSPIRETLSESSMTTKTPEQLATEVVSGLTNESEPTSIVKEEVIKPSQEIIQEPITNPTIPTGIDITKLVETITSTITESSKAQLEAVKTQYEDIISKLKSQLEVLTSKVSSQEEIAQAFSTSISNQAKAQEYKELAANGVPSVLIQKFSQIQSALEAKQTVVKLSTKAANGQIEEKDIHLKEAIKDLMVSSLHTEPVHLQRFGQTSALKANNPLQQAIDDLTKSNYELAQKKILSK